MEWFCGYNRRNLSKDFRIKALPRIFLRLATGVAAFLFIAFAALVLWLRYAALPNVDRYRTDIVSSIEKSSGMAVKVRSLSGGWGGLRPVISLEGLEISDRSGRAAFQLQRAEVSLSWWAMLIGRVRFHDVDFYRPDLVLRRGADGLIYLADKPLNESGPQADASFTEWLLAQPRLSVHDATLTWRDDFGGAPELRLTGVEIAVQRHLGHHRASLIAIPPPRLAGRIDLRADVLLVREQGHWRANGEAFAESLNADLAALRAHLPVPETLRSGVGSMRMWLKFTPDGVSEVVGDLRVRNARAQLAADSLPLELATLAGRAVYRANPDGFSFATQGLNFRMASGMEAQGGNFSLTRSTSQGNAPRVEVRGDGIDLKIAAALVDYFPVPRDLKSQVLRFAPRGKIAQATLSWSDDATRAYAVKGRFENLGINAVDTYPGVTGFTGSIEGTEAGGEVQLSAKNGTLELQNIFRAPLALTSFRAHAKWRHVDGGLEVLIEDAHFANADAEGAFAGTWRALPHAERSPGFIDLKGTFSRANPAHAATYFPNRIAHTRDWIEAAVQGGDVTRASFELRGDLYEFPFGGDSKGLFLFEGDIRNVRLRYHPSWPAVDAIDGTFRFENRRMAIVAARAAIFASRVRSASAVIDDLGMRPPTLVIDGDIDTSGVDSVRFLRESPLVNGPGAFTRAVAIEGPARLKLHLAYPLGGTEGVRVTGDYQFSGATASVGRTLALREIKGRLSFTERGVRAPELTGTMFAQPATLQMSTEPDGRVLTAIEGSIDAPVLGAYIPESISARLSGSTAFKARVFSGAQGTEVLVVSDLKGLASTLPEPAAKPAGDARPFSLHIDHAGAEGEVATAGLEGGPYWRSSRIGPGGSERWQIALKVGGPVTNEPNRDGLWIYGEAPFLDVDAWMGVFAQARHDDAPRTPEEDAPGLALRGVDLKLGRVRYLSREFTQLAARLERSGTQWNGSLEGPLMSGEVQWSPQGKGSLTARLAHLSIPESKSQPGATQGQGESDLPALDVQAELFEFRGRKLGRLDLKAQQDGEEWRIDRLDIASGNGKFHSSGGWQRTGSGSKTSLALTLDAQNLNGLLGQFGYGGYVSGSGHLEGSLSWPGFPYEFSPSILSGKFRAEARRGQFAKLEPGAGKLLGLLSLQSLPRRATLDFQDVFSEGFAFESIAGNVKVALGVLTTENFEITGPSAFVSLSGEASLPHETQALTVRVVPEVGEGVALAATVLGTPVLGLSTLLVSKILKNPFGKAVAYEFRVTGSWDNPVVARVSAPPAPAQAASTAAEVVKQ